MELWSWHTYLSRLLWSPQEGHMEGEGMCWHVVHLSPCLTEQPEEGDTQYVGLHHLNVGLDVMLYGKRFHICDVDSNTRVSVSIFFDRFS